MVQVQTGLQPVMVESFELDLPFGELFDPHGSSSSTLSQHVVHTVVTAVKRWTTGLQERYPVGDFHDNDLQYRQLVRMKGVQHQRSMELVLR